MGGDHAPGEIVAGAVLAAREMAGEVLLVGREAEMRAALAERHLTAPANLILHHTDEVVEMDDDPMVALRQKVNSSLTKCVDLVRDGEADGALSAGNSGAFMAAATMRVSRLPGVPRPAIAVTMPTRGGKTVVLDAGANMDCKPDWLLAFALMGSAYAEHGLGIANPRVGVLSIGTEDCKGDALTLAAGELLATAPVNFIGNVEGNQIYEGAVDVTVCDGFVGNVVLKVAEGVGGLVVSELKSVLRGSLAGKLAGLLLRPRLRRMAGMLDHAEYGGALLLGVKGVCLVCHGKADARTIAQAIRVAAHCAQSGVVEQMAASFEALQAARGVS